jgi:MFS transporter, FLVCR family, feline leukemia virus subgroup C receptor-related protein
VSISASLYLYICPLVSICLSISPSLSLNSPSLDTERLRASRLAITAMLDHYDENNSDDIDNASPSSCIPDHHHSTVTVTATVPLEHDPLIRANTPSSLAGYLSDSHSPGPIPIIPPSPSSASRQRYIVYSSRFLMLGIFSFMSLVNAMMWIGFSAVSEASKKHFNASDLQINLFALTYEVLYIPFAFTAASIMERTNLRVGIMLGAGLTFIGAVFRMPTYVFHDHNPTIDYVFVLIGQSIAALAQCFILATPPLLSQHWFPPRERVSATSCAALLNQAGIAIGFFLSPALVQDSPSRIPLLMGVQAALAFVALVAVFFGFRSEPPSPPSRSAHGLRRQDTYEASDGETISRSSQHRQPSVVQVLGELLAHKDTAMVLLSFGILVGVFYAFSTVLAEVLSGIGYSSKQSGWIGAAVVLVGLAGAAIAGYLADRWITQHKMLMVVSSVGVTLAAIWWAFAAVPHQYTQLLVCAGVIGFFATAILPLGFDIMMEISFPQPQAIASNLLMMSAQVFGILLTIGLSVTGTEGQRRVTVSAWVLVAACAAAVLFAINANVHYKRLQQEQEHEAEQEREEQEREEQQHTPQLYDQQRTT